MSFPSPAPFALLIAAAMTLSAPSARSVIYAGGDGTGNNTAPGGFAFANVGLVYNTVFGIFGSGVYLGDGWVLGAYHNVSDGGSGFLFGDVYFGASPYTVEVASAVRLTTPGVGPSDLALFHLAGPYPVLPALILSSTTPTVGSELALLGNGRNRQAAQTQWNVTSNPGPENDVWTETGGAGDVQGYKYGPGAALRWGKNKRNSVAVQNEDDGYGITKMFRTTFSNDGSAIANEAQAAPGDSGGGVFFDNGSGWELAGIMLSINAYETQPPETAMYGTDTYIANIATYRPQIVGIVPEPGSLACGAIGTLLLALRRRRSSCGQGH